MTNIAFYYSGSKWQYNFLHSEKYGPQINRIIHSCQLCKNNLEENDVLIVPRESNQEILLKEEDKLLNFLEKGKTLVSFGEISIPWLPGVEWVPEYAKFEYEDQVNWDKGKLFAEPYEIVSPEHPLFTDLTINDLQWHFHGAFHAPATAEVLLKYGNNCDLLYIDSKMHKGNILATTLDPVVHAGYGVIKKTQKFLDSVLDWAKHLPE